MPAKITQSLTDNSTGQISISDVQKTINDFITKVELHSIDPTRNPVRKHYSFDITLERLRQVIEGSEGADGGKVRINLALNLPSQLNCTSTHSIENFLSILVCGISENGSSLLRVNDSILAEGFIDFGGFRGDCCVQGNPPGND
jgi:hypothetical protein